MTIKNETKGDAVVTQKAVEKDRQTERNMKNGPKRDTLGTWKKIK